jgi:hypothetical protein
VSFTDSHCIGVYYQRRNLYNMDNYSICFFSIFFCVKK